MSHARHNIININARVARYQKGQYLDQIGGGEENRDSGRRIGTVRSESQALTRRWTWIDVLEADQQNKTNIYPG